MRLFSHSTKDCGLQKNNETFPKELKKDIMYLSIGTLVSALSFLFRGVLDCSLVMTTTFFSWFQDGSHYYMLHFLFFLITNELPSLSMLIPLIVISDRERQRRWDAKDFQHELLSQDEEGMEGVRGFFSPFFQNILIALGKRTLQLID